MDKQLYINTTYAAWLGKIIGIRLGAPVEGWTSQQIEETYGELKGYPVDYGVFAADDDSNGPLFFVRALDQLCSDQITAEMMGENLLNWLCDGTGFFWWGGVGVSSEHTAYHNLKSGMTAPCSGSAKVNGQAIAEQIGGQIFSDCWGYVAMGDPSLAKNLATKMSSVMHDRDGIQGGVFVAVAIALAYEIKDCKKLINETLKYLDSASHYVAVIQDIISFHEKYPTDWKACLTYIQENYGYDRYPGVCHIIPNTAIMILSLLYGENDFSKTLLMLCQCGWDTDCTCGNVGSIMGAMVGLEAIDEYCIKPINDVLLSSSCMGYDNIDSVSRSALQFCDYGLRLHNQRLPEELDEIIHGKDQILRFEFPHATKGFQSNCSRYTETSVQAVDGKLRLILGNVFPNCAMTFYVPTYYLPEDVYDARYEPSLSPKVYPGEHVSMIINNPKELEGTACIYVELRDHQKIYGDQFKLIKDEQTLEFDIPSGDFTILHVGVEIICPHRIMHEYLEIQELRMTRNFDYTINFAKEKMEKWGLTFGETTYPVLSQCVLHSGQLEKVEDGVKLIGDPEGMLIFSDSKAQIENIELEFEMDNQSEVSICFDVHSARRYSGFRLSKNRVGYVEDGIVKKWFDENANILSPKVTFSLKVDRKCGSINVEISNVRIQLTVPQCIDDFGAVAIHMQNKASITLLVCKLVSANSQ